MLRELTRSSYRDRLLVLGLAVELVERFYPADPAERAAPVVTPSVLVA